MMEKQQKPEPKSDAPSNKEDDVLRQMLRMPPKPQTEKPKKKQKPHS